MRKKNIETTKGLVNPLRVFLDVIKINFLESN